MKYGGFKMSCDLTEMMQRQFYYCGTYLMEEEIIRCWQLMAAASNTIFDVGANVGIYSLAALAVQPQAHLHAFEPTPEIADQLRSTATLNALDRLYVHQAAVSSRTGSATLRRFRGEFGTNGGMNFIAETPCYDGDESVQTVTLDQFCKDNSISKIDLMKIDIQGHEYSAFRGAEHLIRTGAISTIFMELNWDHRSPANCPATQSVQLLERAHYLFSKPCKRLNWQPAGDWLRTMSDVVARREQ